MAHLRPRSELGTHDVTNQPPPFEGVNLFETDAALKAAIVKNNGATHSTALANFGDHCGSEEAIHWSRLANKNPPQLKSFDRYGHRLDEVEFHPAYHSLMALGFEAGIASHQWQGSDAGHIRHCALMFMLGQTDGGVCCPMSMTYAASAALRNDASLFSEWSPRLDSCAYDPRFIPVTNKTAATIGMAMTEKQGGSDIRANTTKANATSDTDYELVGHKWFCSAPMCDAFLTLAVTDNGMTCFLVPRWRPDGTRNAFHIMQLKDKLGDRSNASSEIEYHGAYARRVGDEGRGVRTIIDMVQYTRLDCVVGSAGGMRAALAQALWHTAHRTAFQKKLIDQPAMAMVLADLTLESEAATALAFRLARGFDDAPASETEAAFIRLATPIAKYWVCKRQAGHTYEALECHGGAGFVEEGVMPRLFRQSPLNAIWEGSGNVIALDILRAIGREPESLEAVRQEIQKSRGQNTFLDQHMDGLDRWFKPGVLNEATARAFAEEMALALQATALSQTAPDYVFDGFCTARLNKADRAFVYGAISTSVENEKIVQRAMPI